MLEQTDHRFVLQLRTLSKACAILCMLVGSAVVLGWALDVSVLKSPHPSWVSMKANTAIAFVLAGLALYALQPETPSRPAQLLAVFCSLAVASLGLLTLAEYVSGFDLGIDRLFFRVTPEVVGAPLAARPAPNTALSFVLLGSALFALDTKSRRSYHPSELLALGIGLLAGIPVVGYAYEVTGLYRFRSLTVIALPTAVTLALIAIGILSARPNRGLMAPFSSRLTGGLQARRLLPLSIGLPFILGWLLQALARTGMLGIEESLALLVLSVTIVFTLLIWQTTSSLDKVDTQRRKDQETLESTKSKFEKFLESAPDAMVIVDARGTINLINAQAEALFQYPREELLGKPVETLIPQALRFTHARHRSAFVQSPHARSMGRGLDLKAVRKDGSEFSVEISLSPIDTAEGFLVSSAIRDITERRRIEEELQNHRENLAKLVEERTTELAATNQELQAFAYTVSHDLRAPLRAIDGFSRIVLEDYGSEINPEARRYLQIVCQSTGNMADLIDGLLSFSRLGRQRLKMRSVEATEIAQQACQDLRPLTEGRKVSLTVHDLPLCQADRTLLKQVFVNLIDNALKFTRTCPEAIIEIGSTKDPHTGECVYFVKDNGVGFDMRYAGKLFGVFQRLHRSEDYEGTGLGLGIVQRIVHRHGGRVWAESERNRGTTFYFTLGGSAHE